VYIKLHWTAVFFFWGHMIRISAYSALLLLGVAASQAFDLSNVGSWTNAVTMICLAYIMIGVGLEFTINKKKLKNYGRNPALAFLCRLTLPLPGFCLPCSRPRGLG
jgi:predicted Na+-dependent transporter